MPMRRILATALATLIVAACGGSSSTASIRPATSSPRPSTSADATPVVASMPPSAAPPTFTADAFATLGEDPVPAELAEELQAALASSAAGGGATATVITPEGMWSAAVGTEDGTRGVAIDSQFGIASGTKPIVAAQVMQLVEAGEISLDAPATEYLPADLGFDTNGATIRQLLGHRSGIPDWYNDAMAERVASDRRHVWKLDELLGLVDEARSPVGTHAYADTNYNLLELVIEHVRDRPLVDVLRNGVLRVDGTDRLIYQPDEIPTEPIAMPRGESRDALEQGGGYLPSMSEASSCGAACAMASDSPSLARWWRAFCAGEVVSRESLTEMATFIDGGYGLGLVDPSQLSYPHGVGHLGANFGYVSSSWCFPEKPAVVVVLTNRATATADLATPVVMAALAD
jgi:D-alanyl-D-alanine carboxypeptidase